MILVTGGTGLVGAHLLLHLAESGAALRALYRTEKHIVKTRNLFTHFSKDDLFVEIEWIKGDIIDVPSIEDAFANVDYVYHCAAYISFDPAEEEKLRKVNIEGTANMVNLALAHSVKKFCHVSSIAALGDTKGESTITEETEWNAEKNHSDYALSKHGAEMEVWRAWQEGLDVVVVNPGLIFGQGFPKQGSGRILQSVKTGQPFYTKGTCGIVAIEDVVAIMMQLMATDISGKRFTIVAENLSYENMLNIIADGMGKKQPNIYANPAMTSFAWRMDWLLAKLFLKKRTFTQAMAKSSHSTDIYTNTAVINALQHQFLDMKLYLEKLAKDFIS